MSLPNPKNALAMLSIAGQLINVIRQLVDVFQKGLAGKITPDQARAEMAKLVGSLTTNDKNADEKLRQKFGG